MNKKPKLVYGIKGKLVSAACMLLVAVIMVVSSTYAWFTLSTAPEVTGIQTSVGANGSLEMALVPEDGDLTKIFNYTGDGTGIDKNNSWGNLVDLDDEKYGLQTIVLNPAKLNSPTAGKINTASPLLRPTYGSDGRVDSLSGQTDVGATFNGTGFTADTNVGIRAVGVASGMTARQALYRSAKNEASDYIARAKAVASQSLSNNGGTLANIALKHASDAAATFTQDDIAPIKKIVTDLVGDEDTKGVLDYVELAYRYYLLALAASAAGDADGVSDSTVTELAKEIETTDLATLVSKYGDDEGKIAAAIDKYTATNTTVSTANTELNALTGDAITWNALSVPLLKLADVNEMTINGVPASQAKDRISEIVSGMSSGIQVVMESGGGVYADIADHCGNYTATVTMEDLEYNGMVLNGTQAKMSTKTDQNPTYLAQASGIVSAAGAPASASGTDAIMTEYYGYIIDLAFRTNAADSTLLLQTAPIDRISEDNTTLATMGHGSTMTFTKDTDSAYTVLQMQELMKALRIVFFNNQGDILATARLNMASEVTVEEDKTVTANLYLVDENNELITNEDAAKITPLNRNQAQQVSVLVYLDGDEVGNDDVAAEAGKSMTGSLNLQFRSSATLVPMDYTFSEDESGTQTPATPTIPQPEELPLSVDGTEDLTTAEATTYIIVDPDNPTTPLQESEYITLAGASVTGKAAGTAYVAALNGTEVVKIWKITVTQ